MYKKLAKLKYLPNNFEIIENGDHVICAISGKIPLDQLNYWNVDEQERIFLMLKLQKEIKKIRFSIYYVSISIEMDFLKSFSLKIV